jgi:hypothetical protein
MNAGDVLTLIGDVAAAAAALFALLALGKANDAIKEAKAQRSDMEEATREATQAAKDAAEDRRAANAEAKAAREEALESAKEASADRLAAAKFAMSQQLWEQEQRLAERVERVGEIVEGLSSPFGSHARVSGPKRAPAHRLSRCALVAFQQAPRHSGPAAAAGPVGKKGIGELDRSPVQPGHD